jgi:hypothetical protein
MADSRPTNATPPSQLTSAELMAFAGRLRTRAESALEQQRDLNLAAALVNRLAHFKLEIRRAADATSDEATERHLRELLGGP